MGGAYHEVEILIANDILEEAILGKIFDGDKSEK